MDKLQLAVAIYRETPMNTRILTLILQVNLGKPRVDQELEQILSYVDLDDRGQSSSELLRLATDGHLNLFFDTNMWPT